MLYRDGLLITCPNLTISQIFVGRLNVRATSVSGLTMVPSIVHIKIQKGAYFPSCCLISSPPLPITLRPPPFVFCFFVVITNLSFFWRQHETTKNDANDDINIIQLAHADGEHAIPLTMANFDDFIKGNEFVFVDFVSNTLTWHSSFRVFHGTKCVSEMRFECVRGGGGSVVRRGESGGEGGRR